jgi:hypothetical protein
METDTDQAFEKALNGADLPDIPMTNPYNMAPPLLVKNNIRRLEQNRCLDRNGQIIYLSLTVYFKLKKRQPWKRMGQRFHFWENLNAGI